MHLKFYGTRASIPFFSRKNIRYGGNTSCVRVDTAGQMLIIDAGSGLVQLEADLRADYPDGWPGKIDMLLSHLHLDHIIGLTVFGPVWDAQQGVRIYTRMRGDMSLKSQVFGAFKPPYWPIPMDTAAHAQIIAIREDEPFVIDNSVGAAATNDVNNDAGHRLTVTPFAATHPDATTAFHITDGLKTFVYLLDAELHDHAELARLAAYCRNADAVIFDATYKPDEYPSKRGWGHSSYEEGIRLAEASGCRRMIFSHFLQTYDDDMLDSLPLKGGAAGAGIRYCAAFDGMEMLL